MTILHLRDLSAYGVVSDVDSFNIPTNAFSKALNVRFDDGVIERAVVFRGIDDCDAGHAAGVSGGSTIGDLTGGGGLAASVDGTTSQAAAACATLASATTGYVGYTLATASQVSSVKVYGSNDQGYVSSINPEVTLTLYGKEGTAPTSSTDGTVLNVAAAQTDSADESTATTLYNTVDVETLWAHIWIKIDHDGAANQINIAELDIFDRIQEPRFCVTFVGPSDAEELIIGYKDGSLTQWTVGGLEVDQSISGYTPAESDGLYTSCDLGGVLYVNRNDRVPWDWKPGDTTFEALANWTSTWRCNVLRSYNDALCAFNVTKSGTSYPTMVKTSETAVYGAVPTTWDETDTTNNATENNLAEMEGDIVDAQTLQSSMVIYTNRETWLMQADGSSNVYSYRRLFNDIGAMSANCAVELEGKHYVFGYNDIWVHDGVGKESISNSRVRNTIFTNLDYALNYRCFVKANILLNEIYFCYNNGAALDDNFSAVNGCNEAAVYNYKNNTWSFITLPNTYFGDNLVVGNPKTYATSTSTYDSIAASYFNVSEASKSTVVMVGDAASAYSITSKIYGLDLTDKDSTLAFDIDTNATLNWSLEKDGADLDEINVDLRGYKNIISIYPQARLATDDKTIEFSFGSADYFGVTPTFTDYMTYDNTTLNKLDYKSGGRYLSFKARGTSGGLSGFSLSGIDIDVEITGQR